MRSRIRIKIKAILVQSTDSSTRKNIAKKQKRMQKRARKKYQHPNKKDTRIINAFGTNGRMIFIGSFD